jgi:Protein of unknwon function (DUF3310)
MNNSDRYDLYNRSDIYNYEYAEELEDCQFQAKLLNEAMNNSNRSDFLIHNISKEEYDKTQQQVTIGEFIASNKMERISEIEPMVNKESNNYPNRYDGDKCMLFIEDFPLKKNNSNPSGMMFCIGSIIKYLWRLERKGDPLDQIDKIEWYLKRMRKYYSKKSKNNELNEPMAAYEAELRK